MAIYKCKMCGGDLDVAENATVAVCDYCGSKQTVPTSQDEELSSLFNRANILRRKCEFDKAEQLYEKILVKDDKQPEAYWGVLLCRYGIEYVEDPSTDKRIPTCHRTAFEAITSDEYYKSALLYADPVQKAIYEQEAKYIDGVQKDILALSQQEEPYDVFICYKETDNGKRTQDSVIANDIYYQLTSEGFKVFYAAITLENKLGSAYEPIIFAALNSAKVMLAIGTKSEYFNAVWVKNEWSRYLKMMKNDKSKQLIPCYRDMDAYELPEEFAHLQAQDMSKIGFISDIVRGIKKIVRKEEPKAESRSSEAGGATSLRNLMKRAYLDLESLNFDSARVQFDKMQDIDPENGEVYLIGLLCDLQLSRPEDLEECSASFTNNNNWRNLNRYADSALKERVDKLLQLNETWKKYCAVKQNFDLLSDDTIFEDTKRILTDLGNYRDSKTLLESLSDTRDVAISNEIIRILKNEGDNIEHDTSSPLSAQSVYNNTLSELSLVKSKLDLLATKRELHNMDSKHEWTAENQTEQNDLIKRRVELEHKCSELREIISGKHEKKHDMSESLNKAKQLFAKIANRDIRAQCAKQMKIYIENTANLCKKRIASDTQLIATSTDNQAFYQSKRADNKISMILFTAFTAISLLVSIILIVVGDDAKGWLWLTIPIFIFSLFVTIALFVVNKGDGALSNSDCENELSQITTQITGIKSDIEIQKKNIIDCETLLKELEQEYPDN